MTSICPTVTFSDPHDYRPYMEQLAEFATRVHIDLMDGEFAPTKSIALDQVWWPGGMRADLHVMYRRPFEHLETYIALGPQLVIVHAEAEGDFISFAEELHRRGVETGVALLQETAVTAIEPALEYIDHVLIFSGKLGYYGGMADLALLDKVQRLRQLKPTLEIGWDGGIDDQNARQLAAGGVDVLNVGGFISQSHDAAQAYRELVRVTQP